MGDPEKEGRRYKGVKGSPTTGTSKGDFREVDSTVEGPEITYH